jgi:hypothetical protein
MAIKKKALINILAQKRVAVWSSLKGFNVIAPYTIETRPTPSKA